MRFIFALATLSILIFNPVHSQNNSNQVFFEPASSSVSIELFLTQLEEEYEKQKELISDFDLSPKQASVLRKAFNDRYMAAKSLIKSNDIIIEGPLYDSINKLFNSLLAANSDINQSSKLVLYKDRNFNAFTLGDNIVFVNLGLLARAQNYEELALVIAHELAHNTLNHVVIRLVENTKIKTDKELSNAIEKINDQEYNRVTALNELLVPVIYAEKELSRKHEFEADSLGMIYYKHLGWDPEKSMTLFAAMKHAEHLYDLSAIDYPAVFGFDSLSSFQQRYSRYSHTSSLGAFSEDKKDYESYLRSHPYETDRITSLLRQTGLTSVDSVQLLDTTYAKILYNNYGEMVYSALSDGDFSDAIYYAIRMLQRYPNDAYASAAMCYAFHQLAVFKQMRMAGKFIGTQSQKNDETIDRLYYALQIMKPEECLEVGNSYRNNIPIGSDQVLVDFSDLIDALFARKFDEYQTRRISLALKVKETPFASYLRFTDERYEQVNSPIKTNK